MVNSKNVRFILGFKLRQFRQERSLSLKSLAEKTGLSISYLSEIEKGKKYPTPEKILHLALALGISFDELVSTKVGTDSDPLPVIFSSPVMREFPFQMYGISPQNLLSLITGDTAKAGALIRTFLEIGQNYDMRVEHLLVAALRSYQKMNTNYFEEIEEASERFREQQALNARFPLTARVLRGCLENHFGYAVDEKTLIEYPELQEYRSLSVPGKPPRLLLQPGLTPERKAFTFGRELGYRVLDLRDRPHAESRSQIDSFSQLVNRTRANYFAGALLMPRESLRQDLAELLAESDFDETNLIRLIRKYQVTPAMFLYRMAEILPRFFGLSELIYFGFQMDNDGDTFQLQRHMNLSRYFILNSFGLREHYCRRWGAIRVLRRITNPGNDPIRVGIERSKFLGLDMELLSLTMVSRAADGKLASSTLALVVDELLKQKVAFLKDPAIPVVEVNETCERCPLDEKQCRERASEPLLFRQQQRQQQQESLIRQIVSEIQEKS